MMSLHVSIRDVVRDVVREVVREEVASLFAGVLRPPTPAQMQAQAADAAVRPAGPKRPGAKRKREAHRVTDPVTGATWAGRGRKPAWLVARERAAAVAPAEPLAA